MATNIGGPDPWRYRCPACGSVNIRSKSSGPTGQRERPEDYRCGECCHHFDEPRDMKRESAGAKAD